MRDIEQTIGNLIDHQKTVYVASIDEQGFPNQKAMFAPRIREGIKTFYLTTNLSSMRVHQFLENQKATLYFCDQRFIRGVQLKGRMEVLVDQESKSKIWRTGDQLFYSKGESDPDYCVLRFTAEEGRYYSQLKSFDFIIE